MTFDLRGFELDGEAAGTGGMPAAGSQDDARDPASTVLDVLAQAFGVVTERGAPGSGTRQRTWLDTFDWRLNKAGLVLEYEHAKRGGRLLLSRDDLPQAGQSITGWQPRRPRLAGDLPAGPVRDQILKLVSPRALLPVARATSTVSVTRLLNADGKTVARLIVERSTASQADVNPRSVEPPPRLAIAEVRGYPGQARKAARLLAGVPGVSPASEPLFDAALRALGRHPADYSGGVDAELTAQMPASVAVATVLLRLLDTLELNLDGVLRDIDTEFLHDLRVSVRRTRSAIKLLGGVLPDGLAGPYAAEFKWLGELTTPTRDLDVHLLGFGAVAGHLVAASAADLEPFR
ncbi:MAG: CHAD domain-containing protein, partial [Streptosporangiaceae bacterium]